MVVTINTSDTIKSNSTLYEAGELDIINSSSDHRCIFPLFKKELRNVIKFTQLNGSFQ